MPAPASRLKLLAIGYNIYPTGLTRVMQSIMRRLADRHEIHFLGIGYSGEVVRDRGLTIYPTNPKGGDIFAAFQAKDLIEKVQPEIVFILHDIWMFEYYVRILGGYRNQLKLVGYIPLDGEIRNEDDAAAFQDIDLVVVYTEWARVQFEQAFLRLEKKESGPSFPRVEVVPYGVETKQFYPLPELKAANLANVGRATAKRTVFNDLTDPDSFVVLNANRPDRRKRIDLTIEGFARFAADKPAHVKLCLHHAIMGQPEREQINALVRKFSIEDRVYLNPLGDNPLTDDQLNLLYNACDVGINTSMGEGWGLTSLEHAATGAAQIVPDHSACRELWKDRAILLPIAQTFRPDFSLLHMGEVSVDSVSNALSELYSNPVYRQQLAHAALSSSQNPEYSGDLAATRFERLFASIL